MSDSITGFRTVTTPPTTAHGEVFDAGIATCNALRTGKPQTGEYDNGNGSLMRILPLAFVPCTDDEIPSCGSSRLHSCPAQTTKFALYLPLLTDIRFPWTPA